MALNATVTSVIIPLPFESILNSECRTVLRSCATFVVQAGRGYISMIEPSLHAGNRLRGRTMEKKRGQDGTVALTFQRVRVRSVEQAPGLDVPDGRCFTFVIIGSRALDAFDGVVCDGDVLVAKVLEQGRQSRQLRPKRCRRQLAPGQFIPPGDGMGVTVEFLLGNFRCAVCGYSRKEKGRSGRVECPGG